MPGLAYFRILDVVALGNFAGSPGINSHEGVLTATYRLPSGKPVHHIQSDIGIAVPGSCGLLLDLEAFRRRYGDASWHSAGSLSSVLQAWGRRHSIDTTLAKDVCLWSLWQPLAVLALNREWHTLAAVIGKQTRKSLIPPALYSQLDSPSAPAPDVAGDDGNDGSWRQDLFNKDRFDVLADAVRKWAPIIMRSDAGLDVECSEAFLTGIAEWADKSAHASDDLGDNRCGAGLRSKFKAEFAINSLLIASMLRKDALLADVATSVLEALLPPCFLHGCKAQEINSKILLHIWQPFLGCACLSLLLGPYVGNISGQILGMLVYSFRLTLLPSLDGTG